MSGEDDVAMHDWHINLDNGEVRLRSTAAHFVSARYIRRRFRFYTPRVVRRSRIYTIQSHAGNR
jgi:hypothetical protein